MVRPVNFFESFLQGQDAAQSQRAMRNRNALAEIDIERERGLNSLMQSPDASPEQYARMGRADISNAITNQREFEHNSKFQAVQHLGGIAQKALALPPQSRKQFLQQAVRMYGGAFTALGVNPQQGLGELAQFPDAELEQRLQQVAAFGPALKEEAGFTLSEGQTRFDSAGNRVASVAPKPEKTTSQWRYLTAEEIKQRGMPEGTSAQIDTATGKVDVLQRPSGGESKPMPVGAIRLAQDAREALTVAAGIDSALMRIDGQIATGKLNLGVFTNLASRAKNASGLSTENSRHYQLMRSTFEKMRNDSLRLNKGVQTEGDAQRAWDELFANLSDEKAVRAQLARIREINARGSQLQQENLDAVYENYGRSAPSSGGRPAQTLSDPLGIR